MVSQKKVPSIEIRHFVLNTLGIELIVHELLKIIPFRLRSYNYSAIHVQVNSIPKGVTKHVQNKTSDFNRGYSTFSGTSCIVKSKCDQNTLNIC